MITESYITSNPHALRMLLVFIGLMYLYIRKRRTTFLFLSISSLSYVLISIILSMDRVYDFVLLVVLLSFGFVLSLKELITYERSGLSLSEFVDMDKYDYLVVIILFVAWFVVKQTIIH